jgi:hypothetical protein
MTETIGKNDKVELVGNTFRKVTPNGDFGLGLGRLATFGMLPTPTAIEGVKWTNTWNPNSQMGQSLSAMAGSGMLPTPKDLLPTPVVMEDRRKIYGEKASDEHRKEKMMSNLNPYSIEQGMGLENGAITAARGGQTSRLSPLFTEEMMGFPLMWTALPFLSENGAPKPSKPTATPSSPK